MAERIMTENDRELIRLVRESEDPEKAIITSVDVLTKFLLGVSIGG